MMAQLCGRALSISFLVALVGVSACTTPDPKFEALSIKSDPITVFNSFSTVEAISPNSLYMVGCEPKGPGTHGARFSLATNSRGELDVDYAHSSVAVETEPLRFSNPNLSNAYGCAADVNSQGTAVGSVMASGSPWGDRKGFVWKRTPGGADAVLLEEPTVDNVSVPSWSAETINNNGYILGTAQLGTSYNWQQYGVSWKPDGTLLGNMHESLRYAELNDSQFIAARGTFSDNMPIRNLVNDSGWIIDMLPVLGGVSSYVYQAHINARGDVAGSFSSDPTGGNHKAFVARRADGNTMTAQLVSPPEGAGPQVMVFKIGGDADATILGEAPMGERSQGFFVHGDAAYWMSGRVVNRTERGKSCQFQLKDIADNGIILGYEDCRDPAQVQQPLPNGGYAVLFSEIKPGDGNRDKKIDCADNLVLMNNCQNMDLSNPSAANFDGRCYAYDYDNSNKIEQGDVSKFREDFAGWSSCPVA